MKRILPVMRFWINCIMAKPLSRETQLPKGSTIDLVIGDGIGKVIFEMPDAKGMDLEEARILILGSNLEVGEINYIDAPEEVPGHGSQPKPSTGDHGSYWEESQFMDRW